MGIHIVNADAIRILIIMHEAALRRISVALAIMIVIHARRGGTI